MQPDVKDFQLLRRFVEGGSQEAFGQLVQRRLSFVYSVCRRELGDATLAEDVTQAVFLILAQKAATIRDEKMLAGWLFTTARYASRNALRRERHRQAGEREAVTEMIYQAEQQSEQEIWPQVEPLLNDGIAALSGKDREAVLLRFFEGRSLKEVGLVLGTTEDTARKRVERAVAKLKAHLKRHDVIVSVALLTGLLTERAVEAAPAACATSATALVATMTGVGTGSLGTGAVGTALTGSQTQAAAISQGVLKAMFVNQIKVATIVVGLSLAGAGGVVAVSHSSGDGPSTLVAATPSLALVQQRTTAPRRMAAEDGLAASVDPEALLKQVLDSYQKLSSFSMRIEHQDSSGLFPGKYTQTLQWRKGGRFELLVVDNNEKGSVPNYYADGTQVVMVDPDGKTSTQSIVPRPNSSPGWEVSGSVILGSLQNTDTASKLFNPPQGMDARWKHGPRKEWHGQKVREILLEWSMGGDTVTLSYFVSQDAKLLVGSESKLTGKPGWELYLDQKTNPALPATLGNRGK